MEREKVLLVRAPNLYKSEGWKKQGVIRTPTNLAMLASYIREFGGYEPQILDFEIYNLRDINEIADKILSKNARYIGFSTLSPRFPTILRIAQNMKQKSPDVITILGGPHITGRPQDVKYSAIDYAVLGEGEPAFLDLLNSFTSKRDTSAIPNIAYKMGQEVIANPRRKFIADLDSLPFPAWDLLEMQEYPDPQYFEGTHVGVFTSRGCPFDCIFCASKVTWERKLRYRSIDNIIEEFTELANKWNIKNIHFYDDQFALKPGRGIELATRMQETGLGLKYYAQIRADSVTEDLAKAFKNSGCVGVAIGVETGNEIMLKSIHKKETKDQIRTAVRILKSNGVPVLTSYIIGLPGDTKETVQETLDFARELNTDQMKFMLLTPVPGTLVYDLAVNRGLLDPNNLEQMERTNFYDSSEVNLSNLSIDELLHYQDLAYHLIEK